MGLKNKAGGCKVHLNGFGYISDRGYCEKDCELSDPSQGE